MGLFTRTSKKPVGSAPVKTTAVRQTPPPEQWRDLKSQHPDHRSLAVKYPYHSLDSRKHEIRLLKVFAGQGLEPIRCSLQHISLSKARERYETISYCWGDATVKKCVEIDGKPIAIGSSAADVIHRMRLPSKNRVLWIDAICIDQSNDKEKGQQVALMGDIYRNSQRNLIWLGHDNGDSKEALRSMQAVLDNIRREAGIPSNFQHMMNEPTQVANQDNALLDTRINLQPLVRLFSSPWWQRVWVAQEAVLAPRSECYFGDMVMPFSDVLDVAAWLNYNRIQLPAHFATDPSRIAAGNMARLMRDKSRRYNDLFRIYTYLQDFHATDKRDHIYAMLGLYKRQTNDDWIGDLVRPDYAKPVEHVLRDATRHMILDGGHLSVLHFVDNKNCSKNFPSWAVRFDRKTVHDHDPVCRLMAFDASNLKPSAPAGQRGEFAAYSTPDANILVLGGLRVARIRHISDAFGGRESWTAGVQVRLIESVISMAKSLRSLSNESWEAELAHTLISGTNWRHERAGYEEVAAFKAFLRYSQKYPTRPPIPRDGQRYDESNRLASRWFLAFEKAARNRRFFITADGRMGLGPAGLKQGDSVAILFGGSVPYVLRPNARNEAHCYLIGECYVHGIMNGEYVRDRLIAKGAGEEDKFFLY